MTYTIYYNVYNDYDIWEDYAEVEAESRDEAIKKTKAVIIERLEDPENEDYLCDEWYDTITEAYGDCISTWYDEEWIVYCLFRMDGDEIIEDEYGFDVKVADYNR